MALRASFGIAFPTTSKSRHSSGHFPSSPLISSVSMVETSFSGNQTIGESFFFGNPKFLHWSNPRGLQAPKRLLTTALIKRKKDFKLDSVIQREKKLKRMTRIKEILVKQPGQVMSLRDLGKYRRVLGLTGHKRVVALLNKFPAVFEVFEEGCTAKYFRFTPQARKQYREEVKLLKEMEEFTVLKLRKLLMMSIDKSIAIQKIKHIRRDLGLPDDFATSDFFSRHSQYFKIGTCGLGPLLILQDWDPALAVTALDQAAIDKARVRQQLEEDLARSFGEEETEEEEPSVLARTPRFKNKNLNLPKGQQIKKKDREKLLRFQEVEAISPYGDKSELIPSSREAEKAAILVVHELLSLTSEKKILVDHLTHFRRDFKFSQRIRAALIRHPEYFYVSLKGLRDSVFLREAYEASELKVKDPLVLLKERMAALVAQRDIDEKVDEVSDDDEDDDGEEGEDEDDDDWDEDDDGDSGGKLPPHLQYLRVPVAPREVW